ncbi:MAG: DUF1127 domain-containing protein [Marivibrio sp.]|uniref:DUF1127 domain-containing protein n=1 Tax=Marivibrio sp. TaxID=2039719 RepID=UPI0032EEBE2F
MFTVNGTRQAPGAASPGAMDFGGVMAGSAMLLVEAVAGAIAGAGMLIDDAARAGAKWRKRAAERRHLAELDDYLLRDIGIDRTRALGEADKPFWRD